jgi:hypothetical protein
MFGEIVWCLTDETEFQMCLHVENFTVAKTYS